MDTSKLSTMKSGIVYRRQSQNNDGTAKLSGQNGAVALQNDLHATHDQNGNGFPIQVFNALLSQQVEEGVALERLHSSERCEKTVKGLRNSPMTCENAVRAQKRQTSGDVVNHPSHYCQGGIECIDAIQAAVTGLNGMEAVCVGNAIKYIWRTDRKTDARTSTKQYGISCG